MRRRSFLRTASLGALAAVLPGWRALAKAAEPPYAAALPSTPFDAPEGTWTLVVMPDTQNCSQHYPEVYVRQCEWIVAHKQSHNIAFVAHEGDITNDNTVPQWENARRAMSVLNAGGVPYCLLPGNHDLGPEGKRCADRSTRLNDYFTEADYRNSAAYGLFEPGRMQNSWHEFDAPGGRGRYLVVALEYGPRDAVVDWAEGVVAARPDRRAILVTHAYVYCDSTRYDWGRRGGAQHGNPKDAPGLVADGGVNDGEDLWRKLVSRHPNVGLIVNGHVIYNGTGRLASRRDDGSVVHQILANYQSAVQTDDGAGGVPYDPAAKPVRRAFGGGGFLRLMRHLPDGTVQVRTYSPWYDRWLTQPDQQFTIDFAPAPRAS